MYRAAAGTRSLITTRDDWALSETGRRGYKFKSTPPPRRAFAMFGVYEHTRAQPVITEGKRKSKRERERAAPNRINQIEGEPGGVKGDEKHNRRIITNSL